MTKRPTDMNAKEVKHIFTELRKAANHPLLCRTRIVGEKTLDELAKIFHAAQAFGDMCTIDMVRQEIVGYSDFELHTLCLEYVQAFPKLEKYTLPQNALFESAKMDKLRTMLPQLVREGHRILLFSQWTRLLDLFEVFLPSLDPPMRCLRLDGSTPVAERQDMIDEFNRDKGIAIFLLSTHAGGLGINLTAADTVILHDLDFNPQNDKQAEDRCHRIGQTKPVTVYKMVTLDTVDESILKIAQRKTRLQREVLGNEGQPAKKIATTELANILQGEVDRMGPPSKSTKAKAKAKTTKLKASDMIAQMKAEKALKAKTEPQ